MEIVDSPTLAVIPVLVGPLQVVLVLLPAIVLAILSTIVSLFRPRVIVGLLRLAWQLKVQIVLMAGVAYGLYWLAGTYWARAAGATVAKAESGADWCRIRGDLARTGRVADSEDPRTGGMRWSFRDGDAAFFSSPAIVGNRVYVSTATMSVLGDGSGRIVCLDADSGEEIWSGGPSDYAATFSSPVVAGDYLVCGEGLHKTEDARIVCLSLKQGQQARVLWTHRTTSHVECTPVIWRDRVYVGAGDDGYYCIALKPAPDGGPDVKWHLAGKDYPDAETSLAVHDGKVYAGLGVGGMALCVFDADTGKQLKRIETGMPVFSPPAVANGRLYVGMGTGDYINQAEDLGQQPRGAVWCFDLATMEVLWKSPTGRTVLGAVAVQQGRCYAASRDGVVYQFDAGDGRLLATFNAHAGMIASPALGERTVYVISEAGTLHALSVNRLDPVWECQVGLRPLFVSSPAVARGHVYVGTESDGLICAGEPGKPQSPLWVGGSASLGDSPLPRHGNFLWQYPEDQTGESEDVTVAAAPALIGDVALVPLATEERKGLVCLPRAADDTPAEDWFHATNNAVVLPPAATGTISGGVDRIFVVDGRIGDVGRQLHCLAGDGKVLWTRGVEAEAGGHLLLERHSLIVDDRADVIIRIDLDGKAGWRSRVGRLAVPPISTQGMLIVVTADSNQLIAMDGRTGVELWHKKLDVVVTTRPVAAADSIILGTTENCTRRSLINGSAVGASITPGVVGNLLVDGPRVWFGTDDGTLHVVDTETFSPIASAKLAVNRGGLIRVRDQIIAAGDKQYHVVNLTAEGDGMDARAWCEDVSWLGEPAAPFSSADGRLWVPARGWGMMCLGGTP